MEKRSRQATSIAQRLAIEHGVTQAPAESGSLAEAAPKIIAAVCETLGWECGSCRAVERAGEALTHVGSWGVATAAVAEFLEQKRTTLRQDPPGGLARRAWLTGEAVWV